MRSIICHINLNKYFRLIIKCTNRLSIRLYLPFTECVVSLHRFTFITPVFLHSKFSPYPGSKRFSFAYSNLISDQLLTRKELRSSTKNRINCAIWTTMEQKTTDKNRRWAHNDRLRYIYVTLGESSPHPFLEHELGFIRADGGINCVIQSRA